MPDCHGVSGEQVRSLVALELAPRLRVAASDATAAAAIVGTVTCDAEGVRIEIDDPQQASPLRLELDLAAAPAQARTRLLALSIAELIATGRLERAPAAPPPPVPTDEEPEPEPAPSPATHTASVWAAPGLSRMGEPGLTLLGVEGGASYAFGPALVLAQLQARWGAADTLAADVAVQAYSAGLALSPRLSLGVLDFAIGPGMRVGYARLIGRPEQPELQGATLSGAWLGPYALAGVQLHVSPWVAVRAAFELGYVTQSVRGLDHESQRLLELGGMWTSASLGAALLLP